MKLSSRVNNNRQYLLCICNFTLSNDGKAAVVVV